MVSSKGAIPPTSLKFRLRTTLVVPFVLQVVAAVGLVGWLSFRSGQQAVNDLASQLRMELASRVQEQVARYLDAPHLLHQINARMVRQNLIDLRNPDTLERYFWEQSRLFDHLGTLAFANTQGEFVGANGLEKYVVISTKATGSNLRRYAVDDQGRLGKLLTEKAGYDARTRSWYKTALAVGQPTWAEIAASAIGQRLDASAVYPLYRPDKSLQGVFLCDLSLSGLSDFLHSLKVGKTGQVFIVESNGLLVANSTQEVLFTSGANDQEPQRLLATQSTNATMRTAIQTLTERFGGLDKIERSQQLDFSLQGKRQFLQVQPFKDGRGIDWLIVVVVPEANFMEQINANTRTTIMLSLLALGLAIAIGILTAHQITRPILQIAKASEDMAGGNLDQNVASSQIIEIEKLANSFNDMTGQLKDSFSQLNSVISQANQVGLKITSSTTQIAATGKQLEANVTQQAVSTNEVSATAREIASTSEELVKTMETIAQQAQATALATSNSQAHLMEMATAMGELATATTLISSKLGILNEKATNINSVVTSIARVADQTNLISLNAAIEAEKAGEYGAGFGVVAKEVRWLADKATVASQDIEQMVQEIQAAVANGVMEMDKFSFQVSKHVAQVGRISEQIASVSVQVQSLTPQFEQVSHSMEGQFEGARQISTAIAQLSEASQQTVASLQQTNHVLDRLNDTAQVLKSIISSSLPS